MKTKLLISVFILSTLFLSAQSYILNDGFEDGTLGSHPTNWIQKYNGTGDTNQMVVENPVKNGTKAFQMEGRSSWASEFYYEPTTMPNLVTVEAWVNPEKILSGLAGSIGLGNTKVGTWGTRTSRLQFFNNKISTLYQDGSTYVIQEYIPNTWYHFKMEHNLLTKTYKVYINGILMSGNKGSGDVTEFPMHPTVSSIQVMLAAGNSGTVKMIWDDIKVYETTSLSISDNQQNKANNFYVFNNTLHFKNTQDLSKVKSISVFNLLAQKVYNSNTVQNENPLPLKQGLYILKVTNKDNQITTKKFMIN